MGVVLQSQESVHLAQSPGKKFGNSAILPLIHSHLPYWYVKRCVASHVYSQTFVMARWKVWSYNREICQASDRSSRLCFYICNYIKETFGQFLAMFGWQKTHICDTQSGYLQLCLWWAKQVFVSLLSTWFWCLNQSVSRAWPQDKKKKKKNTKHLFWFLSPCSTHRLHSVLSNFPLSRFISGFKKVVDSSTNWV